MRARRTSGSEGGAGKRSGRKVATAPRSDPTTSRSARPAGWCRWRPSWRPAWRRPASGACSGSSSPPGTTRARPGRPSSGRSWSAAWRASGWSSATTIGAWSRPSTSSSSGPPGSAAGSTSPGTPRTSSRARPGGWSRPSSGRSSSSPTRPRPGPSCGGWSTVSRAASRPSPTCSSVPETDLLVHFTFPDSHRRQIRIDQPARAAQQGDPGVGLVHAGRAATVARTVGDRAAA